MSVPDFQLPRMRKELPRVEARMKVLIAHVRFLTSMSEMLDARLVMSTIDEAKTAAIHLRMQFLSLVSEVGSLKRVKAGADRSELASSSSRLAHLFLELEKAVSTLNSAAVLGMNKPGRWGDAAAEGAISGLVGLLGTLFEIWGLEKAGQRLRAKT